EAWRLSIVATSLRYKRKAADQQDGPLSDLRDERFRQRPYLIIGATYAAAHGDFEHNIPVEITAQHFALRAVCADTHCRQNREKSAFRPARITEPIIISDPGQICADPHKSCPEKRKFRISHALAMSSAITLNIKYKLLLPYSNSKYELRLMDGGFSDDL